MFVFFFVTFINLMATLLAECGQKKSEFDSPPRNQLSTD